MIIASFTLSGYLCAKQELFEEVQNTQITKECKEELEFDSLTIYIKKNDYATYRNTNSNN